MRRPAFDVPGAAGVAALHAAVDWVIGMGALRQERLNEILTQITVPYPYFAMVLGMQAGRHRWTYELMSAALQLSGLVVHQYKQHFRVRRPADRSPLVQPMIETPRHGSFPAGHSTQCALLAETLIVLVANRRGGTAGNPGGNLPQQLRDLAKRISDNRAVAGVHYKDDLDQGTALGTDLADYFVLRAQPAGAAATPLQWLWTQAVNEPWV